MASDNLQCLIGKIKSGEIDPKIGKELLNRAEYLNGHFKGDHNRAVRVATEQFQGELERQSIRLNTFVKTTKEVGRNFETMTPNLKKEYVQEAIGGRVEYQKRGLGRLFESVVPTGKEFNKAENASLMKAMLGEEVPKSGRVADAVESLRKGEELIRRALQEFGEGGIEPPKNSLRVSVPSGKVTLRTAEEFVADMKSVNTDFLVENLPYFHKIKGGLDEYLDKMYHMLLEGPGMHTDLDWGTNASKAISDFKKSIYVDSSEKFVDFNSKYGAGEVNLLSDYAGTSNHVSEQVARMAAFGGDTARYSKFIKDKLKDKDLLDGEMSDYVDSWMKYATGEVDQWSHRHKKWQLGANGPSVVPYKMFSALKTASMIKVQTGGVVGALGGDLLTINKALKDIGFDVPYSEKSLWNARTGDKDLAHRMALSTEWAVDRITDQTRLVQEDLGSQTANKVSTWASRVSGLEYLTRRRREGMMFELSHQMAVVDVPFKDLDEGLITAMRFAGIGETEWKQLKSIDWPTARGGKMMDPGQLKETDLPLARKLTAFFERIKENGIPTNGIAKQKFMKELVKGKSGMAGWIENMFIFQGWNSSMYENHLRTAVRGKGGTRGRINFAKLTATLALWKVAQETLENGAKGETTNFEDPTLYYNSFVSSGAFPVFGDFAEVATSEFNTLETMMGKKALGVTFGSFADVGQAFYKAGDRALQDKETHLKSDLYKVADGYNPLSKIWHTKKLWDEVAGRHIKELLDEGKALEDKNRKDKRLWREDRRSFWDDMFR